MEDIGVDLFSPILLPLAFSLINDNEDRY